MDANVTRVNTLEETTYLIEYHSVQLKRAIECSS